MWRESIGFFFKILIQNFPGYEHSTESRRLKQITLNSRTATYCCSEERWTGFGTVLENILGLDSVKFFPILYLAFKITIVTNRY